MGQMLDHFHMTAEFGHHKLDMEFAIWKYFITCVYDSQ